MQLAGHGISPHGVAPFFVAVVSLAENRAVDLGGRATVRFGVDVIALTSAGGNMATGPFTLVVGDLEGGAGDAGKEASFADVEDDAFCVDDDPAERAAE